MSWSQMTLGEVIRLKRGHDLPARERIHGEIPIISSSGITGYHNSAKVEGPGVVTGRYGTLGEVHYVDRPYWPLNTSLYVEDFKGNHPRFVAYLLMTLELGSQNTAGAVPGVNRNALHQLLVSVPNLDTQVNIASALKKYDDLIETNRRRIFLLEESARLLYREWFVNLRFPGFELVKRIEGIPEGWSRERLDSALLLQRGFDLPNGVRKPGSIPIYASAGINGYHSDAKVKGPGVVTGRSGTLGLVHYVSGDFWPLNTALWVKEFRRVTPLFAYFMLSEMNLAQYNSGASVPSLDRKVVHPVEILIPPEKVIELFGQYVEPLFEQAEYLREANLRASEARDALLPKLMSGAIQV